MPDLGHIPYEDMLTTYFQPMVESLYFTITKGSQAPDGCYEAEEKHSEHSKDSETSVMDW